MKAQLWHGRDIRCETVPPMQLNPREVIIKVSSREIYGADPRHFHNPVQR